VLADALLLRRTMTNLVSNAVKYSPATEPIAVVAIEDESRVRVEVVDHGVGLSAKEAAMAFRPFWRAGNAATRGKRGAGIGLSLVAEYVRVMGGQTGVLSEPGRGSTFFFTLRRPTEAVR
jgi:signal transduction histidine kinase